jgi:GST-like protein
VAGDYSIADMAAYPWSVPHERQQQNLEDFPHLKRRFETIRARPATERAYARAREINDAATVSDARSRQVLFGPTASAVH